MTLDDLYGEYSLAFNNALKFVFVDQAAEDRAHRAGIRAVVAALRDEVCDPNGATQFRINCILASDGEEAGTHGSPELDEDARKLEAMGQDAGMTLQDLDLDAYITTPAAAPVCEWLPWQHEAGKFYSMCGGLPRVGNRTERKYCPNCQRPISIKSEAAR